jgi:hypothetical protein
MKPEAVKPDLFTRARECLTDGITPHWAAIAANEHAVRTRTLLQMVTQDRNYVWRDRNGTAPCVGLGIALECSARLQEFDSAPPDGYRATGEIHVLSAQRKDLATSEPTPGGEQYCGPVARRDCLDQCDHLGGRRNGTLSSAVGARARYLAGIPCDHPFTQGGVHNRAKEAI